MTKRRGMIFGALATAFLATQAIAAAHEYEHALEQHDDPSCALHLYFGHLDKVSVPAISLVVDFAPNTQALAPTAQARRTAPVLAYRGRAPPARRNS